MRDKCLRDSNFPQSLPGAEPAVVGPSAARCQSGRLRRLNPTPIIRPGEMPCARGGARRGRCRPGAGAGTARRRARCSPSEPLVFGDGRVTIGGDVSATFSCADRHPGQRRLRRGHRVSSTTPTTSTRRCSMLRVDVDRRRCGRPAASRSSAKCEARTSAGLQPYALYRALPAVAERARSTSRSAAFRRPSARSRGASTRRQPADRLSAGLSVPDVASARRAAGERRRTAAHARPRLALELLARQPDAGPRRAARQRVPLGHGRAGARGERRWSTRPSSVTTGTLANPLVGDDNGGKQVAGRVSRCVPLPGLSLGVSGARGPYLSRDAARGAGVDARRAGLHADGLGRRRRVLARLLPGPRRNHRQRLAAAVVAAPTIDEPLARRVDVGRRPLQDPARPLRGGAARSPGFSDDRRHRRGPTTWDAPVTRVEVGGGYSLQRNLLLKLSVPAQHARRRRGRHRATLGAAQVVFWF